MIEIDKNPYPELDPTDSSVMDKVLRLARFYLRNTNLRGLHVEDDIRQIVLMKLLEIDKEIDRPESYLKVMVRNTVFNYLKKINYHDEVQIDENDSSEIDQYLAQQSIQSIHPDMRVLLSEIWEKLDNNDRHTLQLLIFGYKKTEMAHILNITPETARQRVSRLKTKLKRLIFSDNGDSLV